MKLYYFESLNPQKACAVARYLGSPVDYVRIDLAKGEHKTPEFLAINPNGKVPALIDGDSRLWEANAIMAHLARAARSDLWPRGEERQIELTRWLSWDANHFTRHAGVLYFQHIIKPRFFGEGPDPTAVETEIGFFRRFASVLNDHLRGRKFILGDALTIADFAIGVTLPYAEKARIPLAEFPEIARWHDRLDALAAWREPFPKREATAANSTAS